ncbi:hypothetical protein EZV62_015586 [Acer yangbiense]|uniref:CW-type domain-containing protein n=1 Tax=Acer yangbiense TaxID=1000413 RepID=A0A5C7HL49_9ROSI|nr:hypothetical protein EZV62_015586 [Acer yangbiense]
MTSATPSTGLDILKVGLHPTPSSTTLSNESDELTQNKIETISNTFCLIELGKVSEDRNQKVPELSHDEYSVWSQSLRASMVAAVRGRAGRIRRWTHHRTWAPLFEVQTDDWECFCSVHWDPTHADCAVPQGMGGSCSYHDRIIISALIKENNSVNRSSRFELSSIPSHASSRCALSNNACSMSFSSRKTYGCTSRISKEQLANFFIEYIMLNGVNGRAACSPAWEFARHISSGYAEFEDSEE